MSLDNAQFIPQEAVDAEEYKRTKEGKSELLAKSVEDAEWETKIQEAKAENEFKAKHGEEVDFLEIPYTEADANTGDYKIQKMLLDQQIQAAREKAVEAIDKAALITNPNVKPKPATGQRPASTQRSSSDRSQPSA